VDAEEFIPLLTHLARSCACASVRGGGVRLQETKKRGCNDLAADLERSSCLSHRMVQQRFFLIFTVSSELRWGQYSRRHP